MLQLMIARAVALVPFLTALHGLLADGPSLTADLLAECRLARKQIHIAWLVDDAQANAAST